MKRRERYESFMKKVDLLADLDPYERNKLCDVLTTEVFNDGQYVIRQVLLVFNFQGEHGSKFYFIEQGKAIATKNNGRNEEQVFEFKENDYFGELALIKDDTRAANIIAKVLIAVS